MILPFAFIIIACPVCNYERVLPTWCIFTALRLVVVLTVAYGRLDLVRTLGAFLGFEFIYYHAWKLAVWYSHPVVAEGITGAIAGASLLVLSIGIPAALFLILLSKSAYFRAGHKVPLSLRRAALLLPVMLVLAAMQGL